MTPRTLDIVSPVFNESKSIGEFIRRIALVFRHEKLASSWNTVLVLVDDGSSDDSLEIAKSAAKKHQVKLHIVKLSRNFGHQAALLAGVRSSRDDACVLAIDSDLQDPIEVIPEILSAAKDFEVVLTRRKSRQDSFLKRVTAWLFYRFLRGLSAGKTGVDSGDFWFLGETAAAHMRISVTEKRVFLRAAVRDLGFKSLEVSYSRDSRFAGSGKYTLGKMLGLARMAVVHYSSSPVKISVFLGASSLGFGVAGLALMVVGRLTGLVEFSAGLVILAAIVMPMLLTVSFSLIVTSLMLEKILEEVRGSGSYIVESEEKE